MLRTSAPLIGALGVKKMTAIKPDADFMAALRGEDELGAVIRAHLHVEAELNELLNALISDPKHLDSMNLSYANKAKLACALGLKEEYLQPLQKLGALRNAFGHRLDTTITEKVIDELYNSFSSDSKQLMNDSYTRTSEKLPAGVPARLQELEPRSKFIFIAVALKAEIELAANEAKGRKLDT